MGLRQPNHLQTDRPESGGADRHNERETSGLLEKQKEQFAVEEAKKARSKPSVDPASRKRGRR
jgi:hypothetical protein